MTNVLLLVFLVLSFFWLVYSIIAQQVSGQIIGVIAIIVGVAVIALNGGFTQLHKSMVSRFNLSQKIFGPGKLAYILFGVAVLILAVAEIAGV